jgi:hypothetical protein
MGVSLALWVDRPVVLPAIELLAMSIENASCIGTSPPPSCEQIRCFGSRHFGIHLIDGHAMQNVGARAHIGAQNLNGEFHGRCPVATR